MIATAIAHHAPPMVQRAPETGTIGAGWLILGVLLLAGSAFVVLRLRGGPTGEQAGQRVGRGLGNAMAAMGALLQPDHPPPEDRPGQVQLRQDDEQGGTPNPDRAPVLFHDPTDPTLPDDGLRMRLPPDGG